MIYVSIAGHQYPATITGRVSDKEWDNRETKAIKLEMSYAEAAAIWVNNVSWSILEDVTVHKPQTDEEGNEVFDENNEPIIIESAVTEEFDNSEYSLAGDIIDHRDGTVTIKMGKPTALELAEANNVKLSEALNILIGGDV